MATTHNSNFQFGKERVKSCITLQTATDKAHKLMNALCISEISFTLP